VTTNTEILDDRLSRLERDIRALHALAKSDPEAARPFSARIGDLSDMLAWCAFTARTQAISTPFLKENEDRLFGDIAA
jgi:hypothetical protein